MKKTLFVCAANLCRSPIAAAIARSKSQRMGLGESFEFCSAGTRTPWPGSPAETRAIEVGKRRGYDLSAHKARSVSVGNFAEFDYILAMDRQNLAMLESLVPDQARARLRLFLEFWSVPGQLDVPDPYFGNLDGFERVFDLCEVGVDAFLHAIADDRNC